MPVYCGNNRFELRDGKVLGTPYQCLKKGVGAGLHAETTGSTEYEPIDPPAPTYCGDGAVPPGKVQGTRGACFRKGFGVGQRLKAERAEAAEPFFDATQNTTFHDATQNTTFHDATENLSFHNASENSYRDLERTPENPGTPLGHSTLWLQDALNSPDSDPTLVGPQIQFAPSRSSTMRDVRAPPMTPGVRGQPRRRQLSLGSRRNLNEEGYRFVGQQELTNLFEGPITARKVFTWLCILVVVFLLVSFIFFSFKVVLKMSVALMLLVVCWYLILKLINLW